MKWCLHIYSLEVTAWRQESQQTAEAILKREKSGKGAVFKLNAVLVTQHEENQERKGELRAAGQQHLLYLIQPFEAM